MDFPQMGHKFFGFLTTSPFIIFFEEVTLFGTKNSDYAHLREILFHHFSKTCAIFTLVNVVKFLEKTSCPFIYQSNNIDRDLKNIEKQNKKTTPTISYSGSRGTFGRLCEQINFCLRELSKNQAQIPDDE